MGRRQSTGARVSRAIRGRAVLKHILPSNSRYNREVRKLADRIVDMVRQDLENDPTYRHMKYVWQLHTGNHDPAR